MVIDYLAEQHCANDHGLRRERCQQVTKVIARDLLDLLEAAGAGGILGEGHSWVGPAQLAPALPDPQVQQPSNQYY